MMQSVDDLLSQLRRITGPEAAPPPEELSSLWIWLLILIALFAFLAGALLRRFRRGHRIAADVEALAELNRLPPEPTPIALAGFEHLSRRYLERVHLVAGDHLTSLELLAVLPERASAEWSAIFAQLQPGRFSPRSITTEEWSALIQQVRPLIRIVHADLAGPVVQ
jgi:hypothetical protein